jgi:hypothetical protein
LVIDRPIARAASVTLQLSAMVSTNCSTICGVQSLARRAVRFGDAPPRSVPADAGPAGRPPDPIARSPPCPKRQGAGKAVRSADPLASSRTADPAVGDSQIYIVPK